MIELASVPNPFSDNVVQNAWQAPADVASINQHVFEACLAGLAAAERGQPDSLLIYGSAGSGKTHLLSRLQRHLHDTAREAKDKVLRCVFVFVRLQTSPELLWQHVRRRLASDLMRRTDGLTQLQRLVAHQIAERNHTTPRTEVMHLRVLGKESHDEVSLHLASLAAELDLPRDLCTALGHLLCDRGTTDASAWLQGESLPEQVLADLGLGSEPEDREHAARELVVALAKLAGGTLPIVFCFDQVEALQRSLDDGDAFFRFGRLAADLHDADPNVFVITCLQSALLAPFSQVQREADMDRFMKRSVVIQDLDAAQVRAIVRSRLESQADLAELRSAHPDQPFYPFGEAFMAELCQQSPSVPRRILARASAEFARIQHGQPTPPVDVPTFLSTTWEARDGHVSASLDPALTTSTLLQSGEVLSTLAQVALTTDRKSGADLVFQKTKPVAVSVRNEVDGRSLTPKLKALTEQVRKTPQLDWVLVRDPRLPVSKSAVRAREYLGGLQEQGVRWVQPTAAALRALEALSSILADAKSGDLANAGETVGPHAVLDWLRGLREDLAVEPVRELLSELFGREARGDASLEQDLGALLSKRRALTIDAAAQELGREPTDLLDLAQRQNSRFLLLNGPPAILLDIAGIQVDVGGAA